MAIASVGTRGTQISGASGTTIARAPSAAVAAGRCLVAYIATRENPGSASIADAQGNIWVPLGVFSHSADNAHSYAWLCNVQTALGTADTITVSFGTAIVDKCLALWEYSVAAGKILAEADLPVGNELTNANGFGAATFSGLPNLQRLYFRSGTKRANSTGAITPTSGFVSHGLTIRSRNNAAGACVLRAEHRIATSTEATSNPVWAVAGNTAALFMALDEVDPPAPSELTGEDAAKVTTSTGGAVTSAHTVSGISAAQATTSTTGSVGQAHVLVGASVAQINASTTGVVTPEQTPDLDGQLVAQVNASTSGAVSSAHTLLGVGAAQGATSTSGGLSSEHPLTGNGSAQITGATTGSVSSAHTVSGAGVAQAQSSTVGSVAQTHVLQGVSAVQGATATTGALDLTYDQFLGGVSVAQPTTSTSGAVSSTHILAGSGVAQPHSSTDGALELTASLAGEGAVQTTTSASGAISITRTLTGAGAIQLATTTSGTLGAVHNLTGDWVLPGWVDPGFVLSSYAIQPATSSTGRIRVLGSVNEQILKLLANRQELDPAVGVFRVFDDDGETVVWQAAAWEDAAGTRRYRGKTLARIDRLEMV